MRLRVPVCAVQECATARHVLVRVRDGRAWGGVSHERLPRVLCSGALSDGTCGWNALAVAENYGRNR